MMNDEMMNSGYFFLEQDWFTSPETQIASIDKQKNHYA